jgi:hypothetical protein
LRAGKKMIGRTTRERNFLYFIGNSS